MFSTSIFEKRNHFQKAIKTATPKPETIYFVWKIGFKHDMHYENTSKCSFAEDYKSMQLLEISQCA